MLTSRRKLTAIEYKNFKAEIKVNGFNNENVCNYCSLKCQRHPELIFRVFFSLKSLLDRKSSKIALGGSLTETSVISVGWFLVHPLS